MATVIVKDYKDIGTGAVHDATTYVIMKGWDKQYEKDPLTYPKIIDKSIKNKKDYKKWKSPMPKLQEDLLDGEVLGEAFYSELDDIYVAIKIHVGKSESGWEISGPYTQKAQRVPITENGIFSKWTDTKELGWDDTDLESINPAERLEPEGVEDTIPDPENPENPDNPDETINELKVSVIEAAALSSIEQNNTLKITTVNDFFVSSDVDFITYDKETGSFTSTKEGKGIFTFTAREEGKDSSYLVYEVEFAKVEEKLTLIKLTRKTQYWLARTLDIDTPSKEFEIDQDNDNIRFYKENNSIRRNHTGKTTFTITSRVTDVLTEEYNIIAAADEKGIISVESKKVEKKDPEVQPPSPEGGEEKPTPPTEGGESEVKPPVEGGGETTPEGGNGTDNGSTETEGGITEPTEKPDPSVPETSAPDTGKEETQQPITPTDPETGNKEPEVTSPDKQEPEQGTTQPDTNTEQSVTPPKTEENKKDTVTTPQPEVKEETTEPNKTEGTTEEFNRVVSGGSFTIEEIPTTKEENQQEGVTK